MEVNETSNDKISVFKTGDKVDIEFLNRYVAPEFRIKSFEYETSLTLDQAKENIQCGIRNVL